MCNILHYKDWDIYVDYIKFYFNFLEIFTGEFIDFLLKFVAVWNKSVKTVCDIELDRANLKGDNFILAAIQ